MSLWKYKNALKESLQSETLHRRVYIPHDCHGDSTIYLCPRCGRKFCLINQSVKKDRKWSRSARQLVEFIPSGVFYHKEERACGQENCEAAATMVEHHPCGLLKSLWQVCHEGGCYLKEKCEVYKTESK